MAGMLTPLPLFDNIELLTETKPIFKVSFKFTNKDYKSTKNFLLQYSGNKETYNSYRREVEKLIQWSWLVAGKSIVKLTREDLEKYIEFCQNPPKSWISLQKFPKFITKKGERIPNPKWRPFVVTISKAERKNGMQPEKSNYSLSQKALQAVFDILNSFYMYLVDEDICRKNPIRQIKQKKSKYITVKQGKREIRRLSDKQWHYVLEAARELAATNAIRHERTLFVISALYLMYLRISELVATDRWKPQMGHFYKDGYGDWWFKTVGKGNKERQIAVNSSMLATLKRYREHRNLLTALPSPGENEPLIHKLKGKGNISDAMQLRIIVQECFDLAIIKLNKNRQKEDAESLQKATVHWLRHTGISDDINKHHRPISHVRDDAGHSSSAITDLYNDVELRKRHASAEKRTLEAEPAKNQTDNRSSVSVSVIKDKTASKKEKSMTLNLWLRVENNNKFVRGKGKVRTEIEEYLTDYYQMKKPFPDKWDYEITVSYTSKKDLENTIYNDIYGEMQSLADMRNCFIEADISTPDGKKSW